MGYYEKARKAATDRLNEELAKPFDAEPRADGVTYGEDEFDPWSLFPSVYGSYSKAFDDLALRVLRNIQEREFEDDDLAAEIFREMLCTADFCSYGTSPRVCFWDLDQVLLAALIDRWTEWSSRTWQE